MALLGRCAEQLQDEERRRKQQLEEIRKREVEERAKQEEERSWREVEERAKQEEERSWREEERARREADQKVCWAVFLGRPRNTRTVNIVCGNTRLMRLQSKSSTMPVLTTLVSRGVFTPFLGDVFPTSHCWWDLLQRPTDALSN